MFEINKIYRTKNGSRVLCAGDKRFLVLEGGHQIRKCYGAEKDELYFTDMDGEYRVPITCRYLASQLDGMSIVLDEAN